MQRERNEAAALCVSSLRARRGGLDAQRGRARMQMEVSVRYCRECRILKQRLYHVRNLGRVCLESVRGARRFLLFPERARATAAPLGLFTPGEGGVSFLCATRYL